MPLPSTPPRLRDIAFDQLPGMQCTDTLWRISPERDWSKAARAPATARWHTRGPDVLYTSTSEALAALEALAHLRENRRPHRLISLRIPPGARVRQIVVETLPDRWRSDKRITRAIGDAWLASGASDLLWVPSVHARLTGNMLVNPALRRDYVATDHGLFRFSSKLRPR